MKNNDNKLIKSIILLCAPRTGSSMFGEVLTTLGVSMGGTTKEGKATYHHGFHGDMDFHNLNREILMSCGSNLTWDVVPTNEKLRSIEPKFSKKIEKLIRSKEKRLWGFKSIWSGFTISLFHQHLNNPYYIVLRRDPQSIANSIRSTMDEKKNFRKKIGKILHERVFWRPTFLLKRVKNIFKNKGGSYNDTSRVVRTIEGYYQKIDEFIAGKKYIELSYEKLLADPRDEIEKLIQFLDLEISKELREKAASVVDPSKKRF